VLLLVASEERGPLKMATALSCFYSAFRRCDKDCDL
jgi:hypothetical protein